ncbi:BQ5605_C001g00350 [Microbotryum silenes-dioicae]|uniref:BQ5605_C001g00350 protein n=1 Tax=Microbotryum silenes-dioicae TaxID=796604 RepID=A0A2X0M349_9BASI|nr:BQ5605_C001g00350 [Microbotryum silenes-dioicae]
MRRSGGEDDNGCDSTSQNDNESEVTIAIRAGLQEACCALIEALQSKRFDATKLPKSFSTLETRVKAHLRMCVIRRHVVPRKASKTTIAKTGSKANHTTTSAYTLSLKEQIELRILGKPDLLGSLRTGLGERTHLWEGGVWRESVVAGYGDNER